MNPADRVNRSYYISDISTVFSSDGDVSPTRTHAVNAFTGQPHESAPEFTIFGQKIAFTPSKMRSVNMSADPFDVAVIRAGLLHVLPYEIRIDIRPLAPFARFYALAYELLGLSSSEPEYVLSFTIPGGTTILELKQQLQARLGIPSSHFTLSRASVHPLQSQMCKTPADECTFMNLDARLDSTVAHEMITPETMLFCRLSQAGHRYIDGLYAQQKPIQLFIMPSSSKDQRLSQTEADYIDENGAEMSAFEFFTVSQLKDLFVGVRGAMVGLRLQDAKGNELADDKTLGDCGITKDATLHYTTDM